MFSSHFLTKVLLQLEAIILWEVIVSQTIFCMFCTFFCQWTVKMIFLSGKCRIGFRRIASQIICYTSKLPRVSNYFSLFHYADNVKYLNLLGWPPLFRRFEETSSLFAWNASFIWKLSLKPSAEMVPNFNFFQSRLCQRNRKRYHWLLYSRVNVYEYVSHLFKHLYNYLKHSFNVFCKFFCIL